MPCEPAEGDWIRFRREVKFILQSKNGGVRAKAPEHTTSLKSPQWVCFIRILSIGRSIEFLPVCHSCVAQWARSSSQDCRLELTRCLFTWPITSILSHSVGITMEDTAFGADVSCAATSHWELWSETLGAQPLYLAPYEQMKLDEAQRKGEKKNLRKKFRFSFTTQFLFLFSRVLLRAFAGDKSFFCCLSCSSFFRGTIWQRLTFCNYFLLISGIIITQGSSQMALV